MRFQFRMRSILVILTVVGLASTWVARERARFADEQQVLADQPDREPGARQQTFQQPKRYLFGPFPAQDWPMHCYTIRPLPLLSFLVPLVGESSDLKCVFFHFQLENSHNTSYLSYFKQRQPP